MTCDGQQAQVSCSCSRNERHPSLVRSCFSQAYQTRTYPISNSRKPRNRRDCLLYPLPMMSRLGQLLKLGARVRAAECTKWGTDLPIFCSSTVPAVRRCTTTRSRTTPVLGFSSTGPPTAPLRTTTLAGVTSRETSASWRAPVFRSTTITWR